MAFSQPILTSECISNRQIWPNLAVLGVWCMHLQTCTLIIPTLWGAPGLLMRKRQKVGLIARVSAWTASFTYMNLKYWAIEFCPISCSSCPCAVAPPQTLLSQGKKSSRRPEEKGCRGRIRVIGWCGISCCSHPPFPVWQKRMNFSCLKCQQKFSNHNNSQAMEQITKGAYGVSVMQNSGK